MGMAKLQKGKKGPKSVGHEGVGRKRLEGFHRDVRRQWREEYTAVCS